jgi:DNA-binding response OmpR family regulator
MNSRIVIADDDDDMRRLFCRIFKREGFETIEAVDGGEAIKRALDSDPVLILLDIMMPGINGFEACRYLKSDPRTVAIPVIFLSASSIRMSREEALRLGAADYIGKPFSPSDLVQRIRAVIQPQYKNYGLT